MSVLRTVRATIVGALAAVVAQALAVLTLDAQAFGTFSLWMLGLGLCSSASLSLVSEAWTRDGRVDDWAAYATPLVALACAVGVVGLAVAVVVRAPEAVALAIAVALSTYRLGARFHGLAMREMRRVEPADVAGVLGTLAGWAIATRVVEPLLAVAIAWAAGAAASVALSRAPRILRGGLRSWARGHGRSIRALLADSALLDATAIGAPVALAPALGLHGFGVYRALSSAAVPVRLILSPLRPLTASAPLATSMRPRIVVLLVGSGALLGAGVACAILALDASGLVAGTVVADLADHALAVGAFVAVSLPLFHAQMAARSHLPARRLLAFRASSLALGLSAPLAGLALAGLPGALWGAAIASSVDAVVVHALVHATRSGTRTSRGS